MNRLKNKVAVITGGNSGIGLSTAKAFIDEGANVVLFGRDQKTLDDAVETLGTQAIAVQGDVTSDTDLNALYTATEKQFGKVDVIFANAGVAEFIPLDQASDDHLDRLLDINVKGTLKTIQRAKDTLNDNASIILTSSNSNVIGMPNSSVYATTKAAIRSFARTLSAELLPQGIRVNAISPGPVETPIIARMGLSLEQAKEMADNIASQVPLKRVAQPAEIANAVVFLASDESAYIVGTEMVIDGGMTQL